MFAVDTSPWWPAVYVVLGGASTFVFAYFNESRKAAREDRKDAEALIRRLCVEHHSALDKLRGQFETLTNDAQSPPDTSDVNRTSVELQLTACEQIVQASNKYLKALLMTTGASSKPVEEQARLHARVGEARLAFINVVRQEYGRPALPRALFAD